MTDVRRKILTRNRKIELYDTVLGPQLKYLVMPNPLKEGYALGIGKPVIPVAFGVRGEDLPGFLKSIQAIPGSQDQLRESVDLAVRPFTSEKAS